MNDKIEESLQTVTAKEIFRQPIRALCFDLDDTLWDNRPVLLAAERTVYDWLARHYPRIAELIPFEGMRQFRLELARREPALRYHMTRLRLRSLELLAERAGYSRELAQPAFEVFLEARHAITLFPDVEPALRQLRQQGFLLGSLTNGNASVKRLGIDHLFDFSLDAESLGAAKPEFRAFQAAWQAAGVEPEQFAYIGDEPDSDIRGALAAGVAAIWMNRDGRQWDSNDTPHAEVRDMKQLLELCRTC